MNEILDYSEATSRLQRLTVKLQEQLIDNKYMDAAETAKTLMDDLMLCYTWAVYQAGSKGQ